MKKLLTKFILVTLLASNLFTNVVLAEPTISNPPEISILCVLDDSKLLE